MSNQDHSSLKRRLAGEGRPPPEVGRKTAEIALGLAIARAGEDCLALEAMAKSVKMRRTVVAKLIEEIPEHALIALTSAAGNRFGLAVLDATILAGVIEKQTTGRVATKPAEPRVPTRTDSVMCADFLNAILSCFQSESEDAALKLSQAWSGFQYVIPLEDARAVQMTLEDIHYRVFEVDLDLEKSAKTGRMLFAFPFDPPKVPAPDGKGADSDDALIGELVQDTYSEMNAVLHREELPLAEVLEFQVGTLIPVSRNAVSRIVLEDINSHPICHGRLGAKSGNRAIRLTLGAEDALEDDVDLPEQGRNAATNDGLGNLTDATHPMAGAFDTDLSALPELPGATPTSDLPAFDGLGDLGGGHDVAASVEDASDFATEAPPNFETNTALPDLPDMAETTEFAPLADLPDLPDLPALDPVE